MTMPSDLNQQLLELVYGLVPDDEAAELRRRIATDPGIAAVFEKARRMAVLLAEASRLNLPRRSSVPPTAAGESTARDLQQSSSVTSGSENRGWQSVPADEPREQRISASGSTPGMGSDSLRRSAFAVLAASACAIVAAVSFVGRLDQPSQERGTGGDGAQIAAGPSIRPSESGLMVALPRPLAAEQPLAAVGQTLATADREKRRVALPDGSVLFLNENTQVSVEADRRLRVDRGQVFVEVAPQNRRTELHSVPADGEEPAVADEGKQSGTRSAGKRERFVVAAGDRELVALGTKFTVAADEAGAAPTLAVVQGRVQADDFAVPVAAGQQLVSMSGEAKDQPALAPAPRSSELLAWTRELRSAAVPRLVPDSPHAGGALVAIDPQGQETKLSLRRYVVDVHIEDGFARTTIDQTYFNHEQQQLEGTFYFPLPADASLSRLAMYVAGLKMEGGMVERDYGRNVFEEIMYTRRDPALLEWVDGSTFKMRVFPLEARHEKRLLLSYTQRLPAAYGRTTYRFPAGHNLEVAGSFATHIRLKGGAGVEWHSPSHELAARTEGDDLVLEAKSGPTAIERDIVLEVKGQGSRDKGGKQVEKREARGERGAKGARLSSVVHEEQRYLMLRMEPELKAELDRPRRHTVILFEAGARDPLLARVQIDAVQTLLEHAEHDDTFGLVVAGTTARPFTDEPLLCTPENVADAVAFLEGMHLVGALDLEAALEACEPLLSPAEDVQLVHVGSGVPILGNRRADELARRVAEWSEVERPESLSSRAGVTYVGVPVGHRWSREFMATAARLTGGIVWPINPDEDVAWKAFELVSTLNAPRLVDVRVTDDAGRLTFLTFASQLAHGEELCAVTRLGADEPLPKSLTVSGRLNDEPWEQTVRLKKITIADGTGYLPRSWAKLEIDRLLADDAAGHKDRIVELSKSMYVMSPYTSLLVLESEAMYEQYKVDRGRSDHWAMYPAPERIPVVYEPPVPVLAKAVTADEPPVAAPTPLEDERRRLARSVRDVLESVVFRSPCGWAASGAIEPWSNEQILAGLSDPVLTAPLSERILGAWAPATTDLSRLTLQSDPREWEFEALDPKLITSTQRERFAIVGGIDLTTDAAADRDLLSQLLQARQASERRAEAAIQRNVSDELHAQRSELRAAIRWAEMSREPQGRSDGWQLFPGAPTIVDQMRRRMVDERQLEREIRLAIQDSERLSRSDPATSIMELKRITERLRTFTEIDARRIAGLIGAADAARTRVALDFGREELLGKLAAKRRPGIEALRAFERSFPASQPQNGAPWGSRNAINWNKFPLLLSPDDRSGADRYATDVGYVHPWAWRQWNVETGQWFDSDGDGTVLLDGLVPLAEDPDANGRLRRHFNFFSNGAVFGDRLDRTADPRLPSGGESATRFRAVRAAIPYYFKQRSALRGGAVAADGRVNINGLVEPYWLPIEALITDVPRVPIQVVAPADVDFRRVHVRLDVQTDGMLRFLGNRRDIDGVEQIVKQFYERDLSRQHWGIEHNPQWLLTRTYNVSDLVLPAGTEMGGTESTPGSALRVFTDLVAHAPGLNTSWADVAAVLDEELPAQTGSTASGTVDPAARELIEQARSQGWEAVTVPGADGEPGLTIVCDGQGRYAWERVVSEGLREDVVCDGQTLWHLYRELGLGAQRTLSRYHRAELRSLVPWILPPLEDLARGADVRLVDERTVAIVPQGSAADGNGAATAEGTTEGLAVHLVFSPEGGLIERRVVTEHDSAPLLRWEFSATGSVRLLDADGSVLGEQAFVRKPAAAPDLSPELGDLVLLPLPFRSEPWVEQHVGSLTQPQADGGAPSEALRLAHVAAAFAADAPGRLRTILDREFFQRGDRRPGFYTLLGSTSARWAADTGESSEALQLLTLGTDEHSKQRPLVQYLEDSVRTVLGGESPPADRLASPVDGFLRRMAEARSVFALWTSRAEDIGDEADILRRETPHERARALDTIRRCRSDALAWLLASTVGNQARDDVFLGQLADATARFESVPALAAAGRFQRATWLARAGRASESRAMFRELYMDGLSAGVLLLWDERFVEAVRETAETRREWRQRVRALHALALSGGLRSAALRLALECHWMDDTALARTLFDRTLASRSRLPGGTAGATDATSATGTARTAAGTAGATDTTSGTGPARQAGPTDAWVTDDPAFAFEAAEALMAAGEFARADRLLAALLADERFRHLPGLWRQAAATAQARGHVADAIVRLDRAVELEFEALPEVIDLAAFREQYTNLLAFYQNAAAGARNDGTVLPDDFTARVLRAADRWRRIDPDDTAACRAAAKVLEALRQDELAWAYLTTPLGERPNEAVPWTSLAAQLQTDGRIEEASEAYATAFDIEPTNAQILWDHASMLEAAGRGGEAQPVYRSLAEGSWQPRFRGLQAQARGKLAGP